MTIEINSQNTVLTGAQAPSDSHIPVAAFDGGVESVIAEAVQALDQARSRSRSAERDARTSQRQAARHKLKEQHKAAVIRAVVGVVQSAAQAVQAGASAVSASHGVAEARQGLRADELHSAAAADDPQQRSPEELQLRQDALAEKASAIRSEGISGGAQVAATLTPAIGEFFENRHANRAEAEGNYAEALKNEAEQQADAAQQESRLADKALGHLDRINEAIHQAHMAAIRG